MYSLVGLPRGVDECTFRLIFVAYYQFRIEGCGSYGFKDLRLWASSRGRDPRESGATIRF